VKGVDIRALEVHSPPNFATGPVPAFDFVNRGIGPSQENFSEDIKHPKGVGFSFNHLT